MLQLSEQLVLMWKCWREVFKTKILINGKIEEIKFASVKDELLEAGGRFIQAKIFPECSLKETEILFEYLVLLAIFTQDLGKLQVGWQPVMRGWQEIAHRGFGGRNPRTYLLAHTDFNPEDKAQRKALRDYEGDLLIAPAIKIAATQGKPTSVGLRVNPSKRVRRTNSS